MGNETPNFVRAYRSSMLPLPPIDLINKLPGVVVSILKELPLFPIEILCDTVMRLMKYLISVAQGVFALVDMILAGVGKVAKVIMDITGVVFKEARKVMKDIFPAFVELDAETQAELDEHGIKDDLKDVAESLKPIAEMGMKIIPMAKQAYEIRQRPYRTTSHGHGQGHGGADGHGHVGEVLQRKFVDDD